jgi:hypothetical protein
VPRHIAQLVAWLVAWLVAQLVTQLVAPLIVDYSASRRYVVDYFAYTTRLGCLATSHGSSLVVDYFAYAARPGASARRAARRVAHYAARHAARHATRRRLLCLAQARRRLLHLRCAFGFLGTSPGSSLVVDYFAYAVRPGASARRAARRVARYAARHAARRAARRRLLYLAQAHHRLLHLRRASGCLGTSPGSSLVVDYFSYTARPGASARRAAHRVARRAAHHAARRAACRRLLCLTQAHCRLLRLRRASGCLSTSRGSSLVVDYFAYAA